MVHACPGRNWHCLCDREFRFGERLGMDAHCHGARQRHFVKEYERLMANEGALPHVISLERGYQANAALRHAHGKALQVVRAKATFRPVADQTLVPVLPCESCLDGGLRAVGTVRGRGCIQRVHVCDTCGTLQLFELPDDVAL